MNIQRGHWNHLFMIVSSGFLQGNEKGRREEGRMRKEDESSFLCRSGGGALEVQEELKGGVVAVGVGRC